MNMQEYLNQKKDLYSCLLDFIDDENKDDQDFENLIDIIKTQNIPEDKKEFKLLLHLISKISNNHYRSPYFFNRIYQILTYFQNDIKKILSNDEILDYFKGNKQIILKFIKDNILTLDLSIVKQMTPENDTSNRYYFYFFPEIKPFFNKNNIKIIIDELIKIDKKIFINFKEKREKGENESHICSLIRNDLIDEFITYTNETNISLSSNVKLSIFETNSLLLKREATLIEYAAFYGSIKIIQYLKMNDVDLTSSLWIYSIHSNNPEMFHFLEENNVNFDVSPLNMYKEAIKCHHNDLANYIYENFLSEKDKTISDDFKSQIQIPRKFLDTIEEYYSLVKKGITLFFDSFCFAFYNFQFIPDDCDQYDNNLYYACYFDYYKIVDLILKTNNSNINKSIDMKV